MTISHEDFERVEIRVGTIVDAREFLRAREPLFQLTIDFGPAIGTRESAAGLLAPTHEVPDGGLLF